METKQSMQATKKRQEQLLNSTQPQGQQQGQSQQQQSLSLPPSSILSPLRNITRSPIGLVPTTPTPSQYPSNGSIPPAHGRTSPYVQPPPNRPPSATAMSQHPQQYSNGSSDIDPYNSQSVHRRKGGNGRADDYNGQYEDDSESAGPASMLFQQQQHAPHAEQV